METVINDFFTPESRSADGTVRMLEQLETNRNGLYLTNQHGQKLLKLVLGNEGNDANQVAHAQIKVLPYGVKRAWVWRDLPSDPHIVTLRDGFELTYHGGQFADKLPKVHLKATSGYTTLINESLSLPNNTPHPVPLFSFETGFANQLLLTNPVTKSAHVVSADNINPVRFDLYLASARLDIHAFVNSIYFFNLFWTPDYLIATKSCPLSSGQIIAPVFFCRMGEFQVTVRRSVSAYNGRSRLHFYNNKNYYAKFMSRRTATRNTDGVSVWSTLVREERRISSERQRDSQRTGSAESVRTYSGSDA